MATHIAPKSLGPAGKALWSETMEAYELRADEREILQAACAEADLIVKMEATLADEPLLTTGSTGQVVAHPLLAELRQHRSTMSALLRGLKLPDVSGEGESNQQRDAANSRWANAYGK